VRTASKMLRVSKQRVYQLIQKGMVAAQTMDGTVLVSRDSVSARLRMQEGLFSG